MKTKKIDLLYIAGNNRSGTTVLDFVLSNCHQTFSMGELASLESFIEKKKTGSSYNWRCSCGQQVQNCHFWANIISKMQIQKKTEILKTQVSKKYTPKENLNIANNCWDIISTISKKSGKKCIIDSSKRAIQLKYLNKTKQHNKITIIFLIRDARAVAYSMEQWQKKFSSHKKFHYYYNLLKWLLANLSTASLLSRKNVEDCCYIVKYENFAKNPQIYAEKILNTVSIDINGENLNVLTLKNKHQIAGTPNKEKWSNSIVKLDTRWQEKIFFLKTPGKYLLGTICNYFLTAYLYNKKSKIKEI